MSPFASMSAVPNSLKGIDPPITLEQANEIARVADAIERRLKQHPPKKKTNPWAISIAQFKGVTHEISTDGTRWVRRERHSEMTIAEPDDLDAVEPEESLTQMLTRALRQRHINYDRKMYGHLENWRKIEVVGELGEHHFEGNDKPPVPLGKCSICGLERIEIKPDHFACPGFYGSPMHYCDPVIFSGGDIVKREEGYKKARQRLEEYCGCTLEEYLEARECVKEEAND